MVKIILFSLAPARAAHSPLLVGAPASSPTSTALQPPLIVTVITVVAIIIIIIIVDDHSSISHSQQRSLTPLPLSFLCLTPTLTPTDGCQEAHCQEGCLVNGHQGQEACCQEGKFHSILLGVGVVLAGVILAGRDGRVGELSWLTDAVSPKHVLGDASPSSSAYCPLLPKLAYTRTLIAIPLVSPSLSCLMNI